MTTPIRKVAVIGAGAWGTALAEVAARAGREVTLYARDATLAKNINSLRENNLYLPGAKLSPRLHATADAAAAVDAADMAIFVVPAQHTRAAMRLFAPHLPPRIPVISSSKGIEIETGALLSTVAQAELPEHPYGVLSGPTFAIETVKGQPTAITLATTTPASIAMEWAEALHSQNFRPYYSDDPVGAEVAGALKNVIAIACGIVEGLGLGQNARAAVMTRGMAEIKRFGMHMGAKPETFLGLSGIGDLTLTCHSHTSRNFSLGVEIGRGADIETLMAARRTVAEGYTTARAIALMAARHKIDMPICSGVDMALHQKIMPAEIVRGLLSRELKAEVL